MSKANDEEEKDIDDPDEAEKQKEEEEMEEEELNGNCVAKTYEEKAEKLNCDGMG